MSERKRHLVEFQARLSERLREAAAGARSTARLGVQVGARRLLVELSEAGEVAPLPTSIVAVPLTHDWFRGLANLRGSLYAVSDLAHYAGEAATVADRETSLVAFAPRLGVNAAVVVARLLGLHDVEAMSPAAPVHAHRRSWLGAEWTDSEACRWTELSLARLAVDARFLSVARVSPG